MQAYATATPRFSPWPVWKDSAQKVRFIPVPKADAARWWHRALKALTAWDTRRAALKTNRRRTPAHTVRQVLHTLIFDFYNFKTGRLDPSYEAIAAKAGCSRATVARCLAALKRLGVLDWQRRCSGQVVEGGRFELVQETNAYRLLPPSQWKQPDAGTPAPFPEAWGAQPPLPHIIEQAAQESSLAGKLATLALEPSDGLASALARLGRAIARREAKP